MGKEEDFETSAIYPGQGLNTLIAQENRKFDHLGLMSAPRTPLRTLIARESGSLWTSEPTDPLPLKSPGRKRVDAGSAQGRSGRVHLIDLKPGRNGSFFKPGSHSPPSGSSSPKIFGTRMGHVSHKIRVFKKGATQSTPQPDEHPVQLGALFAQERASSFFEESHSTANLEQQAPLRSDNATKNVLPLRDLIAAELASSCSPTVGMQSSNSIRSPATGMIGDTVRETIGDAHPCSVIESPKPTAPDESQELRYLFAKDWAMQTSDEEDEFWDSGSLCGVPMPLRSCPDPKPRTRFSQSEKLFRSSHFAPAPLLVESELEPCRINSPSLLDATRVATQLGGAQALNSDSPGRICCTLAEEPQHGANPSLGALLAEEVATGVALADPRGGNPGLGVISSTWSVPAETTGESSRRLKIGSLSDISAPVHPESQSQLDVLIAKILTLRANAAKGRGAPGNIGVQSLVRGEAEPVVTILDGEDDGGGSTSESVQATANVTLGEDVDETNVIATESADGAPCTDVNLDAQMILLVNPSSPEVVPHSSLEESASTIVESRNTVSSAGAGESSDEVDDGDEVDRAESNLDGEEVEAPRVQLGTLLERTRGEHGWLPLGRSRIGSPLLVRNQQSSSSTSRFSVAGVSGLLDANYPSSPMEVPSGDHPGIELLRGEPDMVPHPLSANSPPEAPVVEAVREVDATPARERPPPRVSLLSLLNQDMEMDEDGLQAEVCGCKDEEQDEQVTEQLDPMCCVCMVGHKGAAFIPCGHTFCRKCCREVRRSIGSCPLCNQAIVDVLKIY